MPWQAGLVRIESQMADSRPGIVQINGGQVAADAVIHSKQHSHKIL